MSEYFLCLIHLLILEYLCLKNPQLFGTFPVVSSARGLLHPVLPGAGAAADPPLPQDSTCHQPVS